MAQQREVGRAAYDISVQDELPGVLEVLVERRAADVLIDGARRVGKSYIAEEFARCEYRSYILIDFLISKSKVTSRHNICPIEVKSGKRYTLSSMNKFRHRFSDQLDVGYVIHTGDYRSEDGVEYLPVYMTPLL